LLTFAALSFGPPPALVSAVLSIIGRGRFRGPLGYGSRASHSRMPSILFTKETVCGEPAVANVSDRYVKLLYQRYQHFAAWLPNTKVLLGDVGEVNGKYFKRKTSLNALGVEFATRRGAKSMSFNDDLTSGLRVQAAAAGEPIAGVLPPLGRTGVSIEFTSQGAFLFHAADCYIDEIEDKVAVGKALVDLHREGMWDIRWSVVDTVIRAGSSTILISNSSRASLELSAKAGVELSNLGNPELGLQVSSERGDVTLFLAEQGLTPLFRLSRFSYSWIDWLLAKPKTIYFGGTGGDGPPPDDMLQRVVPDLSEDNHE